jgi:PAS domain S-box-containing protein
MVVGVNERTRIEHGTQLFRRHNPQTRSNRPWATAPARAAAPEFSSQLTSDATVACARIDHEDEMTATLTSDSWADISLWESRHSKQRYERLVRTARDLIFVLTPDGRIVSVNPAFERITGWSRSEWLGRPILALVDREDHDKLKEHFGEHLNDEPPPGFEIRVHCRDGSVATLAILLTPEVEDNRVIAMLGVGRDVTEQKTTEEALRRTQEQLRQQQKLDALGRLAGGVAHDFNNLLTVILGFSEDLLARLPGDDVRRRAVEQIALAGKRASDLTKQLLAFSRQRVVQPKRLNLNAIVAELRIMLERLLGKHIRFSFLTEPSLAEVVADPGHIEQIIVNLAINARDAMPVGGVLVIETKNGDGFVVLKVSDTGVGMSSDVKARMFEPFFTTKEGRGTGLGLATVASIVEQCHGRIMVDTEPGCGTSFRVYLPQAATPAAIVRRPISACEDSLHARSAMIAPLPSSGEGTGVRRMTTSNVEPC